MNGSALQQAARVLVKRANTAERVAVALRTAIAHGELVAGSHVRQEQWASELGVSRAPVREAMKMLVSERLLSYDTHRGYFVSDLDPDQMTQVYLIRTLLETEVLRTIRWPSAEELSEFRKLGKETVDLLRMLSVHEALDAARALQFAIFDLSPKEFLVGEVKRYWGLAEIYRALSMGASRSTDPTARHVRSHQRELFAALASHDRRRLIENNKTWRRGMVAHYISMK